MTKNPPYDCLIYDGVSKANKVVNAVSPLYKNVLPDQNTKTGINALTKIRSKFRKREEQQVQAFKWAMTLNDEVVNI